MAERQNRIYGMIGLAQRAGKVRAGEFSTEKSIKSGKARLCIIAEDASEATKKHFNDMCSYRNIPICVIKADKNTLGHITGRELRASLVIEDSGFADRIRSLIEGENADE